MDRLTFEGNFCDISRCQNTPGGSFCEGGACSQRKVWERLKEYEDAGLSPQACVKLREIEDELAANGFSIYGMVDYMQTVSAALDSADAIGLLDYTLEASETLQEQLALTHRMVELMRADKDGRLVVLPWIPGLVLTPKNALYIIDEDEGKIYEDGLYEAEIGMNSEGRIAVNFVTLDSCLFYDEDIGKTVFLTREEAEEALEGRK